MRRLLTASICTFLCLTCAGQRNQAKIYATETGIDLGAAIGKGALRFMVGHQFSGNFSIEATHTIMLNRMSKGMSDEEKSHYSQFYGNGTPTETSEKESFSGDIRAKYWIKRIYEGGFIMTGFTLGGKKGIDATTGIGYSIRLWKGIRLAVSYEIGIRESANCKRPAGNGFGLTLSYIY